MAQCPEGTRRRDVWQVLPRFAARPPLGVRDPDIRRYRRYRQGINSRAETAPAIRSGISKFPVGSAIPLRLLCALRAVPSRRHLQAYPLPEGQSDQPSVGDLGHSRPTSVAHRGADRVMHWSAGVGGPRTRVVGSRLRRRSGGVARPSVEDTEGSYCPDAR